MKERNKNLIKLRAQIVNKKHIIKLKKEFLAASDYKAIKYAEGLISEEEYASIRVERQEARDAINLAEEQVAELEVQVEALRSK